MRTLKLIANVDEQHHLWALAPNEIPPGPIEIVLTVPDDDEKKVEAAWETGIAHEWSEELNDTRQDVYSLNDGEPIDGRR